MCLEDFHKAYLWYTLGPALVPPGHAHEVADIVKRSELSWQDRAMLIASLAADLLPVGCTEDIKRTYRNKNADYSQKVTIIKRRYE